jgi:hypothetical protein
MRRKKQEGKKNNYNDSQQKKQPEKKQGQDTKLRELGGQQRHPLQFHPLVHPQALPLLNLIHWTFDPEHHLVKGVLLVNEVPSDSLLMVVDHM